jgi:hypothetical protein
MFRASLPRRLRRASIGLLLLSLLVGGVAGDASLLGQTRRTRPPAAASEPAESWLTDDQGRSYRLEPLPKAQGVKLSEGRIRTMWGVQADIAREDDQFFYMKIYKVGPPPPPIATARPMAPASPPEPLPRVTNRLRWTSIAQGLPTSGQWREGVSIADVTRDGRPDIIASPARKTLRPPSVFVHDAGQWRRAEGVTFPARPFDYGDIATADLDGDGALDVVLGVHLRGLIAMKGTATGAFVDASSGLPFITQRDEVTFSSRAIDLADCTGDGRLDIIALGEGPRLTGGRLPDLPEVSGIVAYVQQADGTWIPKRSAAPSGVFGSAIATGDVDGDGHVDVVTGLATLGDNRVLHRGDGACGWEAEALSWVRPRSYVTAVAARDVDGDGRADLVLGYTEFAGTPMVGIDVLLRAADGKWTRRALARAAGRTRIEAIAVGDVDANRTADIAVLGAAGAATIFLGDGRGGFTRERQVLAAPGGCDGGAAATGDLDGDGMGDLVFGFSQEASTMNPGGCAGEGALVAWKTQKAPPAPPAAQGQKPPAP